MDTVNHKNPDQATRIMAYLQDGGALTGRDAQRLFHCDRLGARIHELRKEGHDIQTENVRHNGKRFARYTLS